VIEKILIGSFIAITAILWLYVAARMITRAVTRTISEWKERKKNNE